MVRPIVQAFAALLQNGYLASVFSKNIYQGELKSFCTPAVNCHSCPAALFACPLGTLQHFFAGAQSAIRWSSYQLGFLVIGFLTAVGVVGGRFVCGWLCPFGFLQELLHRIPSPKFKIPALFGYMRHFCLAVLVVILPVALSKTMIPGDQWFCKTVCPAGTLEAGGLMFIMPELIEQIGPFFIIKAALLAVILILAILTFRPYCRTLCPLGLIYGFFNRFSLIGVNYDSSRCRNCLNCVKSCKSSVDPRNSDGDINCIRCFDCARKICPNGALSPRPALGRGNQESGATDPRRPTPKEP